MHIFHYIYYALFAEERIKLHNREKKNGSREIRLRFITRKLD